MNRFYTTILAATALTFTAAAQQLPNAGFEEAWVECVPWTSANNTTAQGTTPTSWNVSNTIGTGSLGKMTVGENVQGYPSSGGAVKVSNNLFNMIVSKVIPGYFGLGTSWATSVSTSNMAGGQFGGLSFTFRPDALQFMYQATGTVQPTVVAYSWIGNFVQENVSGNIAMTASGIKKVTMQNRDRCVLGMDAPEGGDVTEKGQLVASINTRLVAETSSWTKGEFEFTYSDVNSAPEMINVIFAAGDYFSTDPVKDNSLTIDDVKLIYFSRLKSLSVNGTAVADFGPNTYEYSVDAEMPTDASAIVAECLGNSGSGKAVVALDAANNKATITVTNSNEGGTDIDGETSHVYTLNFKVAEEIDPNAKKYNGKLKVICEQLGGELTDEGGQDATVQIVPNADNTSCTFLLPDFALGDIEVGDIKVENVEMTPYEGGYKYYGNSENMKLGPGGEIDADVVINGTIDAEGKPNMTIDVIWHFDGSDIPINVYFAHSFDSSAIGGIESDVIDENAPVEYYNIQGVKVNGDNLAPGFYIVRQGKKVSKIFVK